MRQIRQLGYCALEGRRRKGNAKRYDGVLFVDRWLVGPGLGLGDQRIALSRSRPTPKTEPYNGRTECNELRHARNFLRPREQELDD